MMAELAKIMMTVAGSPQSSIRPRAKLGRNRRSLVLPLGALKEEKVAREAKSTDRQCLGKDSVVASALVYIVGRSTSMFCFVGSAVRDGA
jgi:hypothetical protein